METIHETQQPTPPKPRRKRILWVILAVVAVLLAAVLTAGLLTEWFGFAGPLTDIALAGMDLANSGSFTVDYVLSVDDLHASGTVACRMDLENRLLIARGDLRVGLIRAQFGIYEDQLLLWYSQERSMVFDISEQLDRLYDSAGEPGDLMKTLDSVLNSCFTALEVEELMDMEKARGCFISAVPQINRTPWLEEHLGLEVTADGDGKRYTFSPRSETLSESLLPFFRKAFLTEEGYGTAMESLTQKGSDLGEKLQLRGELGIRQHRLENAYLELELSGRTVRVTMEFSELGKTDISTDAMQALLDAKE